MLHDEYQPPSFRATYSFNGAWTLHQVFSVTALAILVSCSTSLSYHILWTMLQSSKVFYSFFAHSSLDTALGLVSRQSTSSEFFLFRYELHGFGSDKSLDSKVQNVFIVDRYFTWINSRKWSDCHYGGARCAARVARWEVGQVLAQVADRIVELSSTLTIVITLGGQALVLPEVIWLQHVSPTFIS